MMTAGSSAITLSRMYLAQNVSSKYLMALDQVITNTKEQMTLLIIEIHHATLATPKDDHHLLSIQVVDQAHIMTVANLAMTQNRTYLQ